MDRIITDQLAKTRISGVCFIPEDKCRMTRYLLSDVMNENEIKSMDYHIKPITIENKLKVLGFMKRFFFRDEPLNNSVCLIGEDGESTCIELEEYSMSSLEENYSFMAVSSTGAIVGVILNGKTEAPNKEENPDYVENCENPKFKKILRLLHHVDKEVDLFERYPNKKSLDIKIASIDTNWRGRGIASELFQRTIENAKELGFDLIRADCSSYFTAKLCERLGFEAIFKLKYVDFLDENGKPILTPSPPHNAMVTYILKL